MNRDDSADDYSSQRRGHRSQRPYSSRRYDDNEDEEAKYRSKDYEADYDDNDDNEDDRRENRRGSSRRFSTFSLEDDSERGTNRRYDDGYRNDYRGDRRGGRSDFRQRDDDDGGEGGLDRRPPRRSYREAGDDERPGSRFAPRDDRRGRYSYRSYRNDDFDAGNEQQDRDGGDTSSSGKDYYSADGGRKLFRERTARAIQEYGSDRPPRRPQDRDDDDNGDDSRSSGMNDGEERPARPPRPPKINPRLDLPVIRQEKGDKGTFYADADK